MREGDCLPRCVGVTGLEPATSRPPDVCANQLRYTPNTGAYFHKRVQMYGIFRSQQTFFRLFYENPYIFPKKGVSSQHDSTEYCKQSARAARTRRPPRLEKHQQPRAAAEQPLCGRPGSHPKLGRLRRYARDEERTGLF